MIDTARVYDPVDPAQPPRVTVDRLWPRGIPKEDPRVGTWMPHVAPSNELRKWYHAHPGEFDKFAADYQAELADSEELAKLRSMGSVTLTTSAKDVSISHVAVLAALL